MSRTALYAVCGLVTLGMLLSPGPTRADAIDGDWCSAEGRHMTIEGPRIVTPAGTRTTGDYDRHAFAYTVPEADPEAGTRIFMLLIDDETVHLTTGERATGAVGSGAVEVWHRCPAVTS